MTMDLKDIWYLKNLLEFEKKEMEKANVSKNFFEYESINRWLEYLNEMYSNNLKNVKKIIDRINDGT